MTPQDATLLFARIDFALRRDSQLTPDEQLAAALGRAAAQVSHDPG